MSKNEWISKAEVLRMLDENGVVFRAEVEKMPTLNLYCNSLNDLISRAAALDVLVTSSNFHTTLTRIEELPSVDAAPVVRCCQCKHWKCFGDAEDGDYDIGTCELYNQGFGAEGFCSNGERRDNDG